MTSLKRRIKRETSAKIFERSTYRSVIVTLDPPCRIGFRLKGTRRTFWLDADTCYAVAAAAELDRQQKEKKKAKRKKR